MIMVNVVCLNYMIEILYWGDIYSYCLEYRCIYMLKIYILKYINE